MMAARTKVWITTGLVLLATLTACSGTQEPPVGTASGSSEEPSSAAHTDQTGTTPSQSTSEPAAEGCSPTDKTVPPGAVTGATADLDGDGRPDELWLADVDGARVLGVRTASGAVLSTEFTSGAPQSATAYGQVLGDGSAIVLLDTGRAVPLYAVVDCELVPTHNEQGDQYTFDKGFTGYGTGVGCQEVDGDGLRLVGYLAEIEGEQATVTSTPIELAGGGTSARNGQPEQQTGLGPQDPLVAAAESIGCADAEPVHEPV